MDSEILFCVYCGLRIERSADTEVMTCFNCPERFYAYEDIVHKGQPDRIEHVVVMDRPKKPDKKYRITRAIAIENLREYGDVTRVPRLFFLDD